MSVTPCFRNKSNLPATPILSSMARTIRYHLGTLAKGSFIITLVKIPRLILTYIHSQLKGKVCRRSKCSPSKGQINASESPDCQTEIRITLRAAKTGERLRPLHAKGLRLLPVVSGEVPRVFKPSKSCHGGGGGTCSVCEIPVDSRVLLQNAYTATAINSTSFCTSARDAFLILVENALRVAAINTVGDFVLFLGKVETLETSGVYSI